ncbi:gliding motility-associated C-terminal domain-containing protein [bacterium]|nr:gliding motility-associated C-terminal domain-containing protein [bacterium]
MRLAQFLIFTIITLSGFAQVDARRTHWVFGKRAHLEFNQTGVIGNTNLEFNGYTSSASYSDENGNLLLYTNGNKIYNGQEEIIDSLYTSDLGANDVVIIPKNKSENTYYIFTIDLPSSNLVYTVVDVTANGGKGAVTAKAQFVDGPNFIRLTAVKHCFSDAYWIITTTMNGSINAYLARENSVSSAVSSKVTDNIGYLGDLISNHEGTKLVLSRYADNGVEVFDFDRKCGEVSNRVILPQDSEWDYPHGLEFSPNDQILYVCFSYGKSQMVQYDANNWSKNTVVFTNNENLNDVANAIDGRMYVNTHVSGIPSKKIDVIHNPNAWGTACNYQAKYINLTGNASGSFSFPNFVSSHTAAACGPEFTFIQDSIKVSKNRCINAVIRLDANIPDNSYDSIRWYFDDTTSAVGSSTDIVYMRYFPEQRIYNVVLYAHYCQFTDTFYIPLDMRPVPPVDLGNDTTLCFGDSLTLSIPNLYDSVQWNDGSTALTRKIPHGKHHITVYNGLCSNSDTLEIFYYPEIWTELGQEYFICEIENETQLLDAGKGFNNYLWHPTGDTSQWIVVQKVGDYMVIVEDFRGCEGSGQTEVKQRCDVIFHIPNAFSPNDDGLNDMFRVSGDFIEEVQLEIYNRWGELVYRESGADPAWKGADAIPGVYMYRVTVKGYQGKQLISYYRSGIVHLVH